LNIYNFTSSYNHLDEIGFIIRFVAQYTNWTIIFKL